MHRPTPLGGFDEIHGTPFRSHRLGNSVIVLDTLKIHTQFLSLSLLEQAARPDPVVTKVVSYLTLPYLGIPAACPIPRLLRPADELGLPHFGRLNLPGKYTP